MNYVKILAILPENKDATVFYRSAPFLSLKNEGVSFQENNVLNWYVMTECDIVFIQRPIDSSRLEAARLAKAANKALWIDYDDDLINIPEHNPYSKKCEQNKENIQEFLKIADVLTVSTEQLKQSLGYPEKTVVIPNAYPDKYFNYAKELNTTRKNYITWRGSQTHKYDLKEIKDELIKFNARNEAFTLCFMGYDPEFITMNLRNGSYRFIPGLSIYPYLKTFNDLAPFVNIVPLQDDLFNRSKSNIAWLEATHAGAITLARNLPEFDKPGVVTYNTPGDFYSKLSSITNNSIDVLSNIEKSREYIKDNLTLDIINKKRLDLIDKLLK